MICYQILFGEIVRKCGINTCKGHNGYCSIKIENEYITSFEFQEDFYWCYNRDRNTDEYMFNTDTFLRLKEGLDIN